MSTLSKPNPLTGVGIALVVSGMLAFFAGDPDNTALIKVIGILHIVAGVFTGLYGLLNTQLKYGSKVLVVQGLTRIVYGSYLAFAVNELHGFLFATATYAIFIAFFEALFSITVATFRRFSPGIMTYSMLNGLLSGIFGVVVLMHLFSDRSALPFVAVLMIGAGILSLLFSRAARSMTLVKEATGS